MPGLPPLPQKAKFFLTPVAVLMVLVFSALYLQSKTNPNEGIAAVTKTNSFQLTGTTTSAGSPVVFTIKKGGPSVVSVRFTTTDGTAKAGVDYDPIDTTYQLSKSRQSVDVSVPTHVNQNTPGTTLSFSASIYINDQAIRSAAANIVEPAPTSSPSPTSTPTPTPTPTPVPPSTLVPADIPDNFDVQSMLEPAGEVVGPSADEVGAFRFTCLSGQLSYDDPIIYPGQPNASHLHQFWGNTGTNAYSTYQTLRTTGGSTCTRSTDISPQRTAYWMPAMLDGAGNAVKPDWINTYYKQYPATDPKCAVTMDPNVKGACVPIPNGLRFITGYNMKTQTGGPADVNSRDWWSMGFDCVALDGGTSYTGVKHTITDIVSTGKCPVGAWLRAFGSFPSCWDGINIDSPDHRAHITSGPQATCPADHPYLIPGIAVSVFFRTDDNFEANKWHLSSDEMVPGAVPGTTLHFDYFEAWSPTVKNMWETNCINGHLSCSMGELGNGLQVKSMGGMGFAHVLVPVSSIPKTPVMAQGSMNNQYAAAAESNPGLISTLLHAFHAVVHFFDRF